MLTDKEIDELHDVVINDTGLYGKMARDIPGYGDETPLEVEYDWVRQNLARVRRVAEAQGWVPD